MASHEEMAAIPLVEERSSIARRQVESGRVQVRIEVEEREERIPVDLASDRLRIERVPKNERIAEIPLVRLEGNTTIIPVVEEEVVVERRLVLVEEIHVQRTSETSTEEVRVKLRSERAQIESQSVAADPNAGRADTAPGS